MLAVGFILVRFALKVSSRYLKKIRIEPTLECFLNNMGHDTLWAELLEYYDELSISYYRQRIYL